MAFGWLRLLALAKLGKPFLHFGVGDMHACLPIVFARCNAFSPYVFALFLSFHKGGDRLNDKCICGTPACGGKALYPFI
jgi:hypothetical protein